MEESARDALLIGVNVFVFIIALTSAILLMTNIINMANYANENATKGMSGTIAETVGVVDKRIISGQSLLTYFRKSNGINVNEEYFVKLTENSNLIPLTDFVKEERLNNYISKKFEIVYNGVVTKEEKELSQYIFVMQ